MPREGSPSDAGGRWNTRWLGGRRLDIQVRAGWQRLQVQCWPFNTWLCGFEKQLSEKSRKNHLGSNAWRSAELLNAGRRQEWKASKDTSKKITGAGSAKLRKAGMETDNTNMANQWMSQITAYAEKEIFLWMECGILGFTKHKLWDIEQSSSQSSNRQAEIQL